MPNHSNPALEIKHLQKSYQHQKILDNISLTINTGEYVGLIGANGVGKTTLFKCILDFCNIDSGQITLSGINYQSRESRAQITYFPEKFLPPYYLTGNDYLNYICSLHGVEVKQDEIKKMFEVLELDESILSKSIRKYSKGMSQKLGLISCFLSGKNFMIFDEPLSGLDPRARKLFKNHLLKLKAENKTLFYSTHLFEDLNTLCDRVIILHEGRIRFAGPIEECCKQFQAADIESAYFNCTSPGIS